jgi:hypothetical protein
MGKAYGATELIFAEPIANALVNDSDFRSWVVRKTIFAELAEDARLLHLEMKARRSSAAKTWWRSHFTEKCRCPGCRGKETDLQAIFENADHLRFAIHMEVKHPAISSAKGRLQHTLYGHVAGLRAATILPYGMTLPRLRFSLVNKSVSSIQNISRTLTPRLRGRS